MQNWYNDPHLSVTLKRCMSYVMANLGCQFDTPGKREPQLRNCFYQIGLWACLWETFLDDSLACQGPTHCWEHIPRQIEIETAGRASQKQHFLMVSDSHPASRFLPQLPAVTDYDLEVEAK